MGNNNYFQFKEFKILQEKSAMKVTTDGILVGAWAESADAKTILDVGTGTGLIALMMAQRSEAKITAIEIDNLSAEEAIFNVSQSPWKQNIDVFNTSFQDFAAQNKTTFDLIVSNPPFFENDKKSTDQDRSNARHTDLLSFDDLIKGTDKLLSETGKFVIILPATVAESFIQKATQKHMLLNEIKLVSPYESADHHRFLMEFGRDLKPCKYSEFSIKDEANQIYTNEFKELTKDFYLDF